MLIILRATNYSGRLVTLISSIIGVNMVNESTYNFDLPAIFCHWRLPFTTGDCHGNCGRQCSSLSWYRLVHVLSETRFQSFFQSISVKLLLGLFTSSLCLAFAHSSLLQAPCLHSASAWSDCHGKPDRDAGAGHSSGTGC